MISTQVMIGIILRLKLEDHGELRKGYAYVVLALVLVYVARFCWSWGPLGWLIPSEVFPMEVRSVGECMKLEI